MSDLTSPSRTAVVPPCLRLLPPQPVVSLTGHRPGDRAGGGYGDYRGGSWDWVRDVLPRIYAELEASTVHAGGALGFDTIGAWLALEAGVRLELQIPFEGHHDRWPDRRDHRRLDLLRERAAQVHVVSEPGYAAWKLHARNDALLDAADVVVALWDGQPGRGTADAVAKALRRGLPVLHLEPHGRTVNWLG